MSGVGDWDVCALTGDECPFGGSNVDLCRSDWVSRAEWVQTERACRRPPSMGHRSEEYLRGAWTWDILFRFIKPARHRPDRSVDLAFLKTSHKPDASVEVGPINELTVYRELLEVGFWRVHETEPAFDLVLRLVARAQLDGLKAHSGIVYYGDTEWDQLVLVELTDPQGQRYGPLFTEHRLRQQIARDWGATIVLARRRAEREREAALAQARERSSPEQRRAHLERILSRLEELETIVDQLRNSHSDRRRGLPLATFAIWQRHILEALKERASLGGQALVSCEEIGADDLYGSPREAKFAAVRKAKQEVRDAIAEEEASGLPA
jgi:hypothetical protein